MRAKVEAIDRDMPLSAVEDFDREAAELDRQIAEHQARGLLPELGPLDS